MFEKIAKSVSKSTTKSVIEIPQTTAFLACVQKEGFRLSYAALAIAARLFGEDSSTQIAAQRGSTLVKSLPVALQPFVCRKSGKYGKGVLAQFTAELPENLTARPVIDREVVGAGVEEYLAS